MVSVGCHGEAVHERTEQSSGWVSSLRQKRPSPTGSENVTVEIPVVRSGVLLIDQYTTTGPWTAFNHRYGPSPSHLRAPPLVDPTRSATHAPPNLHASVSFFIVCCTRSQHMKQGATREAYPVQCRWSFSCPWLLLQRSFAAAGAARQKRHPDPTKKPINSDGHAAVCPVSRFTAWIWPGPGRHCSCMANCLRHQVRRIHTCWGTASCTPHLHWF
jgi:hypothetical protein